MKNIKKILPGILVLFALQFGLLGCFVGVEGRRGGRGGGGVWFQDGSWMDGGHGAYGHDNVHPPGFRR
jgi:hypothetical protein